MLIGFHTNHILSIDPEERQENSMLLTWINIDCMIMLLRQGYVTFGLKTKLAGEVTKNVYSLYFLQKKKLEEEEREMEIKKKEAKIKEAMN